MSGFSEFLNQNLLSIVVVLAILVVALIVVSIIALTQTIKLRKRYELFTGGKRRPEYNMEYQFKEFHATASKMEERYETLAQLVRDMDKNMSKCVQKVGVIRYNPFDEVGGNLCYAVALLDTENNGVVLNGIHSRTGSFTYAKPIQLGVSEYVLSEEELKALEMAITNSYTPERRSEILDELEKRMPIAYGKNAKDVPFEELSEEDINLKDILASKDVVTAE
ncbi:MAG: DUF4446 family protein [Lachnospiraceae bacterium]|nr:DUF4446 family protein [Lachnospiraceae bacterium]